MKKSVKHKKRTKSIVKRKEELKENIVDALELPKEIILDLPLITIIGKKEMLIENHKNIIEYNDDRIRLNTSCGILKIEGHKMYLKEITSEKVLIKGVITLLEYLL